MYCTNCGTKNNDDAAFCTECGSPLNAAENLEAAETIAEAQAALNQMNNEVIDFTEPASEQEQPYEAHQEPSDAYQPPVYPQAERGAYDSGSQYGSNSPYSAENTRKLNNQTRNTIIILVAAVVVIAAICAVLSMSGIIGAKTYKTYEALVESYLDDIGSLNSKKLMKYYNKDVVASMREAYSWASDDETFLQDSDYLYYAGVNSSLSVPKYEINDFSDYSSILSDFDDMKDITGKDLGVLEAIVVEIDGDLSDDELNDYDSYYLLTLYRTEKGWYLLFVS